MIFVILFNDARMKKNPPFFAILLIVLLFIQVVGALYGGISLVMDTSGELLQMPLSWLRNSPFTDYLIPGIILLLVLGMFPTFILFSLIFRPKWKWANLLNIYPDRHFAWTYSLYLGIMLNIWITVQVYMIGYGSILQTIFSAMGILVTVVSLIPSVMNFYHKKDELAQGEWRTL